MVLYYFFLCADASQGTNITKVATPARHQKVGECDNVQCGQACFTALGSHPICLLPPPGTSLDMNYTLRDTGGVITRFNASETGAMPVIRGLEYTALRGNSTAPCPYIQYTFYDTDNLTVGASYLKPGQVNDSCIIFASNVMAYSGVTMLVPPPEEFLGIGNFLAAAIRS